MSSSEPLAGAWLGIDLEAELATLSTRQLHGPWQVPAELVRELLRRGASSVEVELGRRLSLRAEGATVPPSELELLAAAFDPARSGAERHDAVLGVEAAGAQPFLWLLGLTGAEVEVRSSGAGRGCRLVRRPGQAPRLQGWSRAAAAVTEISVRGGLGRGVAEGWLRSACRFAPVPVEVAGERLAPRFPDGLLRARVDRPLPALLSIASSGEAPLLWLLQHGVVSTRATVPGYPAFQAAVELGGLLPGPSRPAALREAVSPFLTELIDQAIALLLEAARRLDDLPRPTARRVTALLLEAADQGLQREQIRAVPLLPWASDHGSGLVSLDRLRAADEPPFALDPELDRRRSPLGGRTVLLLGAEERRLVGEALGVHLEAPPRPHPAGFAARAYGWLEALRGLLLEGRRPIPERDVTADESRFLEELRVPLALLSDRPLRPVLLPGRSLPGRAGDRLLLPRRNALVVQCVAAVARNPTSWIYPALLALTGPETEAPAALRTAWRELRGEPASGRESATPRAGAGGHGSTDRGALR